MLDFIPTGYLQLGQAIERLTKAKNLELAQQVEADQAEWKLLYQLRAVTAARQANLINVHSFSDRNGQTQAKAFSDADAARFKTLDGRQSRLAEIRQEERGTIRQALGDGALASHGLTAWGAIIPIPVEAWRTSDGAGAMNGNKIKWWAGNPLYQIQAVPLLLESEFIQWAVNMTALSDFAMALAPTITPPSAPTSLFAPPAPERATRAPDTPPEQVPAAPAEPERLGEEVCQNTKRRLPSWPTLCQTLTWIAWRVSLSSGDLLIVDMPDLRAPDAKRAWINGIIGEDWRAAIDHAVADLWKLCGDGLATAEGRKRDSGDLSLRPIPKQFFREQRAPHALYLFDAICPPLGAVRGIVQWDDVQFDGAEIARLFCPNPAARLEPEPEKAAVGSTIADERRCEQWLIEQMQASPTVSPGKAAVKQQALAAGQRFTGRGFERAYANAVRSANAPAWSAPGRKSKRRIDTPVLIAAAFSATSR